MKLTPVLIEILLHVYATAEPFNHPEGEAWIDAKITLIKNDLICHYGDNPCGYSLTGTGEAFVKMLLNTPLPKSVFVDPRTNEVIK